MAENENGELGLVPEHVRDADSLPIKVLRVKYPREWNSWRNGKSRAGENWPTEFNKFQDFLRLQGPAPPEHTQDRAQNRDPRYGVGYSNWASKRDQQNNRANTIYVDVEGERLPLTVAAERLGVSPDTLRKRHYRLAFGDDPWAYWPWPYPDDPNLQRAWEEWYQRVEPGSMDRFTFLIRSLRALIEECSNDLEDGDWREMVGKTAVTARRRAQQQAKNALAVASAEYPKWKAAIRECARRRSVAPAPEPDEWAAHQPPYDPPDDPDDS